MEDAMRNMLAAGALVAVAAGTIVIAANDTRTGLVVHEWGTFLAVNGSDGVALDGMYHEEHALPAFVHARSRDGLKLPASNLKGETPVVYFYSDYQAPVQVRVEVGFPRGLWTQWYPQAEFVGPSLVQLGSPPRPRGGRIGWNVTIWPAALAPLPLPETPADALWNYTRDVDAAYVSAVDETRGGAEERERFIFYRGLGEASLPIEASAASGARVTCSAGFTEGLRHVYLLRVEAGRGAYQYLPSIPCGDRVDDVVPSMADALPLERFAATVGDDLAAKLVDSGLYPKEARAMVNTWRTSYFTTDGIRVLFVLPQSWTDRFIPMTITPAPAELVRVMVGRVELLTPERERQAEAAIADLASPDPDVRAGAFATLRDQGRYVEPIVRRTLETTSNAQVRMLCRRLLLTDFVTEIRTSLTSAADGSPLVQEPVYARAQLADLLRETGLTDEARQEGERALAELAHMPSPTMTDHASRNTFRALARASEAAGREAEALAWYAGFVEFGSGFKTATTDCTWCHALAGPRDTSFFRDWWAGRKYAELAWKTGEAQRLIEEQETALATSPHTLHAQIRLAYLYAGRGETARAQRICAPVEPRGERLPGLAP
jgi:hypothetical protein